MENLYIFCKKPNGLCSQVYQKVTSSRMMLYELMRVDIFYETLVREKLKNWSLIMVYLSLHKQDVSALRRYNLLQQDYLMNVIKQAA
jgi:hypothetical protein